MDKSCREKESIRLVINQNRLVENMKLAFSDRFSVVGEMVQNARRSGASRVDVTYDHDQCLLEVRDDGAGVSDFQKLLAMAESGWDEEVSQRDRAYGLGFFSALFAAKRVQVISRGKRVYFDTEVVLAGDPIEVEPFPDSPETGAIIRLEGINLTNNLLLLEGEMASLACGYPIPIVFNGRELARPLALDGGRTFVETPIGKVSMVGIHHGEIGSISRRDRQIFLQGVLVSGVRLTTGNIYDRYDVVHLDPTRFWGRMPDRNCLVNEKEAYEEISKGFSALWDNFLEKNFARMTQESFYATFHSAIKEYGKHFLSRLSFIPKDFLDLVSGYPYLTPEDEPFISRYDRHIYRDEIEKGSRVGAVLCSCFEENPLGLMYLFRTQIPFLSRTLPEDHWAKDFLFEMGAEARKWDIRVVNEKKCDYFSSRMVCGNVILCEKYEIWGEGFAPVEFTQHGIWMEEDGFFIIPDGEVFGRVVNQACDYHGEWSFYDLELEEDKQNFSSHLLNLRTEDPAAILANLIKDLGFSQYPRLHGTSMRLIFDDKGNVAIEDAA